MVHDCSQHLPNALWGATRVAYFQSVLDDGYFHCDTSNPQRPTAIVKFLGPPRPAPTTPLASFVSREPEFGNIISGVFTPVLAKHSKSFSLIDCISVGVDRMQRNFEPMRKQLEMWQRSELTDVTAKVIIYEAFVEGGLEAPKHLARTVHDLYFEPKYEEFRPRTIWSLSNGVHFCIQRPGSDSTIQGDRVAERPVAVQERVPALQTRCRIF